MAMSGEADAGPSVLPAELHIGAVAQARSWSIPTTARRRLATVNYFLFPLRMRTVVFTLTVMVPSLRPWEWSTFHGMNPMNGSQVPAWTHWIQYIWCSVLRCIVSAFQGSGSLLVWLRIHFLYSELVQKNPTSSGIIIVCFQSIWFTVSSLVAL